MNWEDAMFVAQDMVTQVETDPMGKPVRLQINADNKVVIQELIALCGSLPWIGYRVLGQVGTNLGYFELFAKIEKPGGQVIVVDFKAKKVLSRQAA